MRQAGTLVMGGAFGLVVVIALSSALSGHLGSRPAPHVGAGQGSSAQRVLARFAGSGAKNTATFESPADYVVRWRYSCAALGSSGTFIVSGDGGGDRDGAMVSELGSGGAGTTHIYRDAGRHYLSIHSECAWSITVFS
jgi:hypothetical protein